jgi:hypothetical protein
MLVSCKWDMVAHLVPRWNVIHFAVNGNHDKALKWLLEKLPKETIANLLIQTTNKTQITASADTLSPRCCF